MRAYSTVDGSPLWGGAATAVGSFHSELSSDGTRLYGVADCELYAINAATGATVWNHRISLDESNGCVSALYPPDAPIVLDGEVYAAEPAGKMVVNAVTGAPRLRFPTASYYGGAHVVVGGAWIFINDERLVAVDTQTGELLWKSADAMASQSLSATGDLILTSSRFYTSPLLGISRITGEVVWNGGSVNSVGGTPVIGTNRIFLASRRGRARLRPALTALTRLSSCASPPTAGYQGGAMQTKPRHLIRWATALTALVTLPALLALAPVSTPASGADDRADRKAAVAPRPLIWTRDFGDPSVVFDGTKWFGASTGFRGRGSSLRLRLGPLEPDRRPAQRSTHVGEVRRRVGPRDRAGHRRLAGLLHDAVGRSPARGGPLHRRRDGTDAGRQVHPGQRPSAGVPGLLRRHAARIRPGRRTRRAAPTRRHRPVVVHRSRWSPFPACIARRARPRRSG